MEKQIEFTKTGNEWVYTYTSPGPVVMQVESVWPAEIRVMAAVGDMRPASLDQGIIIERGIFAVDVPAGLMVTISCSKVVTKAMMSDGNS